MFSRNMKTKALSVSIILSALLFSASTLAITTITGRIVAVDEQANIMIALPEGQLVPEIGDRVELSRSMQGGIAAANLVGTWTVTDVNGALINADLQKTLSGEDRPRVNEKAHIFLSDVRAGKEQYSPLKKNKSYAERLRIKCEQGDMPACVDLGLMYKRGDRVVKDEREAFKLIKPAAERGYARAQYELSFSWWIYFGDIDVKNSRVMQNMWLRKAADQGMAEAQATLGHHNVINDISNAEKWFLKAAEQGHREAQYTLGLFYADYFKTKAIKVDDQKAAYWYRKAADQHHRTAQAELASMYESGKGIPRDQEKAIYWYRRAADNGYYGYSPANSVLEKKGVALQDSGGISNRKRKEIPALKGIHVTNLTDALRQQHNIVYEKGVMVTRVKTGSPVEDLLLEDDLIMTISGKTIKDITDYETMPYVNLAELKILKVRVKRKDFFVDLELPLRAQDETTGKKWTAESIESGVQKSGNAPSTSVDGIADDLGEL